jgi:acyl-coenzyme A synthetase/AMP-(fatty) acid ligase
VIDESRPIVWLDGRAVSVAEFLAHVSALAEQLPAQRYLVNLCEKRYHFILAFCAALVRGQTNLLPASRVQAVVDETAAAYSGSYRCDDEMVARAIAVCANVRQSAAPHANVTAASQGSWPGAGSTPQPASAARVRRRSTSNVSAPSSLSAQPLPHNPHAFSPQTAISAVPAQHIAAIAFTSGSTGQPKSHIKRWGSFLQSTPLNAAAIRRALEPKYGNARPCIVATVPPQHMYGMETSVLLPVAADMAVHAGRPLFPADVIEALNQAPSPRVLVSTPVHLRALLASGQKFPEIGAVVSATAPLDAPVALAIEREWGTVVLEMFGSTETCVIATRLTAKEEPWTLYRGVSLNPAEDSTWVNAPWFDAPTALQDVVELLDDGRFLIRGRNVDMIEVAGKRASLADLTRRLLSVPGVEDAVIFQPDAVGASGVRRVAALVVAPHLSAETIVERLSRSIDPVFIPRPLAIVPVLPRNELGKLPRDRLLAALKSNGVEDAR